MITKDMYSTSFDTYLIFFHCFQAAHYKKEMRKLNRDFQTNAYFQNFKADDNLMLCRNADSGKPGKQHRIKTPCCFKCFILIWSRLEKSSQATFLVLLTAGGRILAGQEAGCNISRFFPWIDRIFSGEALNPFFGAQDEGFSEFRSR